MTGSMPQVQGRVIRGQIGKLNSLLLEPAASYTRKLVMG